MTKVAAYCRVSTDKEDQANSFTSQQRYFKEYIERQDDWELYDVYADEGVTGTSTKRRTQFNRMMNDAHSGKFQLIITKEVSRFSRNILDSIVYTRELKALGVGVIFMSDGFSTLDPDAELRLSIMGSIAQEESRKISSRVKWGQTRQMERGVVFGRSMLGYDVVKGKMTVDPEGAEIVKQIFYKYGIEKKGSAVIARELQEAGIETRTNHPVWSSAHILKILRNEKYVGDLVQKKTITPDYLTHVKKYNHGEEDLIIHRNHHEAIISRELWELVQDEIRKRNRNNHAHTAHSVSYVFSGKIRCAECGAYFVARVKKRTDGSSYRRWGCYLATKYGKKRTDEQGNVIGCNVGRLIRDELALDILKTVLRNLPVPFDHIIKNITCRTVSVLSSGYTCSESTEIMNQQIRRIQKKNLLAIDAFLSGSITKEELQKIKKQYHAQVTSLEERLNNTLVCNENNTEEIYEKICTAVKSVLSCSANSEVYLKTLLDYMMVHKDGTVEVKLNQLNTVWKFRLEKR